MAGRRFLVFLGPKKQITVGGGYPGKTNKEANGGWSLGEKKKKEGKKRKENRGQQDGGIKIARVSERKKQGGVLKRVLRKRPRVTVKKAWKSSLQGDYTSRKRKR